jgi:hypothetical protein
LCQRIWANQFRLSYNQFPDEGQGSKWHLNRNMRIEKEAALGEKGVNCNPLRLMKVN